LCYVAKRFCVMLPRYFVLCDQEILCYVTKRVVLCGQEILCYVTKRICVMLPKSCVMWPRDFML